VSVNGSAVAGSCRLRFRTPDNGFELVVPTAVPLADLLPAILGHGGEDLAERGLDHAGWVLQRLGEEPLDEQRSAGELGLRDGELVHLRPRREQFPPVHFDDLVDGLFNGLVGRRDSWRPAVSHHLALALALVCVAGAGSLLLLPGPRSLRDLVAALLGVALLAGAGVTARVIGDRVAAIALAAAAVPMTALAGALLPGGAAGSGLDGARLLAGGSAAAGAAVLGISAIACAAQLFIALLAGSLFAVLAGVLTLAGFDATQDAAVLVALAVILSAFVPSLAFLLSGLRLPALPRNAQELQEHLEPFPAEQVERRGRIADGFLSAFHVLLSVIGLSALAVLANGRGWAPQAMAAALAVLLLAHAYGLVAVAQRLPLLLAGSCGALLLLGRVAVAQHTAGRLGMLAGLVLAATALLIIAWTLPGRRMLPYWARAVEVLHTLTAISLLPLAVFATGAFGALRGLFG
jgi:type VII secretion integral membrane protein EccD